MLSLAPAAYLYRTPKGAELQILPSAAARALPEDCVEQIERIALGLPVELDSTAATLCEELVSEGWLGDSHPTRDPFLEEGLRRIDARFAWAGGCAGDGYEAAVGFHARRRAMTRTLGQYPALPETVARRAALVGAEPKRILLLGDDDLLAPTLATLGHRVTVVDADENLLAFIAAQAADAGLELETETCDLRLAMPAAWATAFDVVFTDPMSSKSCLSLFIDRALTCLKPGGTAFVCVSNAGARWFDFHRRETRSVLKAHHSDFNHYYSPYLTLSSYVSDLYALERAEVTRATVAHDEGFYEGGLYDEERYGYRQASRFVIKDIDETFTELVHLKAIVTEAMTYAEATVDDELYHWDEDYRAYLALLPGGRVLSIAVNTKEMSCEVLMSPPEDDLERVVQAALMSVFRGKGDASASVRRVRSLFAAELL